MKFQTQPHKPTKNKEVSIRITPYGYVCQTSKGVEVNITDERPECRTNEQLTVRQRKSKR